MTGFIGFLIGIICGGFIGMLMMGLMAASSNAERCEECRGRSRR